MEEKKDFSTLEQEIAYRQENAEKHGNKEGLDAVQEVRDAVTSLSLSLSSIRFKSEQAFGLIGGTQVMGEYEESSDQISTVGSKEFREAAEFAGISVREYAERVLKHETLHRQSRRAAGAEDVDNLLVGQFGDKAIHNTEEAAASIESGSDRFDAYDSERSEAGSYASKLSTSVTELNRIRLEGDSDKLEELIVDMDQAA